MQGMPNKISDQDLYSVLLNEHKLMATTLCGAVLEAGEPKLRQEYQQCLNTTLDHQYKIWQEMNQKGYYKPLPANQQEITQVQQEIQKASQQLPGNWQAQGQNQTQNQGNVQLPNNWVQSNRA